MKAAPRLVQHYGEGPGVPGAGARTEAPQERLSALLGGIAAGDRAALAALYDETSPVIFGLLRRVLGAGAEADEALVEVYACVWRKAASYRPGGVNAFTWLVSTALACVSGRGRPAAAEVGPAGPPGRADESVTEAGGAEALPAHVGVAAARAREAFRRLDPKQREALQQSYFYGPGRLEAALGLSTREAREVVSSGLRSYARMLGGASAGEDESRAEAGGPFRPQRQFSDSSNRP